MTLHPRILCAKFGWNRPFDFLEEDEQMKSSQIWNGQTAWNGPLFYKNQHYVSSWYEENLTKYINIAKKLLIWTNFTQRWCVPSLDEIGPVVPEKKMKMLKVYDNNDNDLQLTNFDKKSSLELSAEVSKIALEVIWNILKCSNLGCINRNWYKIKIFVIFDKSNL